MMVGNRSVNAVLGKIAWYACCSLIILLLHTDTVRSASDADVDLFFVIDNSGSMRKNDPDLMMPQTVGAFLQHLSPTTRVGMVIFDQSARLLEPLAPVSDDPANQRLMQRLSAIDYRGEFTNSAAGIERALYELKTSGRPTAQKCIMFLTDGIVDTGNKQKDAELTQWLKTDLAVESKKEGIRIFGIAFTENADFYLIQALSQRTGGAYYRALNPDAVAEVLKQIQAQLAPVAGARTPTKPSRMVLSKPSAPAAIPKPATISKIDTGPSAPVAQKPSPPASEEGFINSYLPLILIAFLLIPVLALLASKIFGRRPLGENQRSGSNDPKRAAPMLTNLPDEVSNGSATQETLFSSEVSSIVPPEEMHLPEWQLHDLERPDHFPTNFDKLKITIGRDEKNNFVIEQPTVSSFHATIEYRDATFFLEDQRSSNGTRLNDRKIDPGQPIRLKSGDRIKFSNREFKFVRLDQLISGDTVLLEVTDFVLEPEESTPMSGLRADDEKLLRATLKHHLVKIEALGPKYEDFVRLYFTEDTIRGLSIQAQENMQATLSDGDQHCSPLIKDQAFFLVCSLPVPIAKTAQWFSERNGGFTKFVLKWIKSEAYGVTACDIFCVVTFGLDARHWVSMTVVPTHDAEAPVEIMSVDFLTQAEKATLDIDIDDQGRVT